MLTHGVNASYRVTRNTAKMSPANTATPATTVSKVRLDRVSGSAG